MTTGRIAMALLCSLATPADAQLHRQTSPRPVPVTGEPVNCPGRDIGACSVVQAKDLAALLTGDSTARFASGSIVDLAGTHVAGVLELEGAKLVHGLRMHGAGCMLDGINLASAQATLPITINCPITGAASFVGFDSTAQLTLKSAVIGIHGKGELNLYDIHLGDTLDVSHLNAGAITLSNSSVKGQLFANDSIIEKTIALQGVYVSGDLTLSNGRAAQIEAEDARIDGSFLARSVCTERLSIAGTRARRVDVTPISKPQPCTALVRLNAANVEIGQNILAEGLQTSELNLSGAIVSGDLGLRNVSVLSDALIMEHINVGGSVDLTGGDLRGELKLSRGTVRGQLSVLGIRTNGIELNSSVIGELLLWPNLLADSTMSLNYAQVGILSLGMPSPHLPADTKGLLGQSQGDCPEVPQLELAGLVYKILKDFKIDSRPDSPDTQSQNRNTDWLVCMLGKQANTGKQNNIVFAIQPYRQMATILRNDGNNEIANKILLAGNWLELQGYLDHNNFFDAGRSVLLYVTIGWGIGTGYIHALYCAIVMTCLGAVILYRARMQAAPCEWANKRGKLAQWCFFASLAELLPIPLSDEYKRSKTEFGFGFQAYFVLHAIIGFFIAACIAAGITGFTQAAS